MMKRFTFVLAFALAALPTVGRAQSAEVPSDKPTSMRDRLMPAPAAAALVAPAPATAAKETSETNVNQPAMASRGGGMGYMIAGAALFVAGILVDGDAGTVLVLAGAGIGAYGLYLHFR
jgi:hypothetical protein